MCIIFESNSKGRKRKQTEDLNKLIESGTAAGERREPPPPLVRRFLAPASSIIIRECQELSCRFITCQTAQDRFDRVLVATFVRLYD